jgi:hypothetical protein
MTESRLLNAYYVYNKIKLLEEKIKDLEKYDGSTIVFQSYNQSNIIFDDLLFRSHIEKETINYYKPILEGLKKQLENL